MSSDDFHDDGGMLIRLLKRSGSSLTSLSCKLLARDSRLQRERARARVAARLAGAFEMRRRS
jgi:hypothetical protein